MVRRQSILALPCLALLLALASCASVKHEWIDPEDADTSEKRGIRYLETSPFLIVHANPDGTLTARLEYLPDRFKKLAVLPKATAARNHTTLEFDRGVLTKADTEADATAVPKALLKAAEAVIPMLSPFLNEAREAEDDSYPVPAPNIYKIVVRGSDVYFIGGAGDQNFRITLVPVEKKTKEK